MQKISFLLFLISLILVSCGESSQEVLPENKYEYILEGSPYHFVLGKTGYTEIADVRESLDEARKVYAESGGDFFEIWQEKCEKINPDRRLGALISYYDANYSPGATNEEIIMKLRNEYGNSLIGSGKVLKRRLENFGAVNIDVKQINAAQISITFYCDSDVQRLRKVLSSFADISFFETYDFSEGYEVINQMNQALVDKDSLERVSQPDYDSSVKVEIEHDQYPLYRLMQPNIVDDGYGNKTYAPGIMSFMVQSSDTGVINNLLKDSLLIKVIPDDMKFLWGIKPVIMGEKQVEMLYTIKSLSLYKAELRSESILSAHSNLNNQTGSVDVEIALNLEGSDKFEELTRNNVNKAIAIVIDGKVISAPIVRDAISGGRVVISGNFTMDEASELTSFFSAGALPLRLKIVDEKKLK